MVFREVAAQHAMRRIRMDSSPVSAKTTIALTVKVGRKGKGAIFRFELTLVHAALPFVFRAGWYAAPMGTVYTQRSAGVNTVFHFLYRLAQFSFAQPEVYILFGQKTPRFGSNPPDDTI